MGVGGMNEAIVARVQPMWERVTGLDWNNEQGPPSYRLWPSQTTTTGESSVNRAKQTWTDMSEQQGYDGE